MYGTFHDNLKYISTVKCWITNAIRTKPTYDTTVKLGYQTVKTHLLWLLLQRIFSAIILYVNIILYHSK